VLWGVDNNFTRNISAKDPVIIVIVKGIIAGSISLVLALAFGNSFPGGRQILLACLLGLFCYGLSIILFILSLRALGTARTSSYFASAPFIGAALSLIIFRELPNALFVISLPLFVAGAFILFTEKHSHAHAHFEFDHDHIHNHRDDHHIHFHPAESGIQAHSHKHKHDPITHEHKHTPDIHHRHGHEK
jgi:drug/metabolite transporter (DMT)-like permease